MGAILASALAVPALAVGLSPLRKEGPTAGPAKMFYLTVINPYAGSRSFRAYVDGDAAAEAHTRILPSVMAINAGGQRRLMVVMTDLAPGETRETRVCAELVKQEGMINARVCSTLVARRVTPGL